MIFKAHVFDEPMLEFGDGGQHCDPRQGLRELCAEVGDGVKG